jgi:hypothetical protein
VRSQTQQPQQSQSAPATSKKIGAQRAHGKAPRSMIAQITLTHCTGKAGRQLAPVMAGGKRDDAFTSRHGSENVTADKAVGAGDQNSRFWYSCFS